MTENLIPNPGFEIDASGWRPFQTTITRSTAEHHSGFACGLIEYATPGFGYIVSPGSDIGGGMSLGMQAGHTYQFSVWMKIPAASGITLGNVFLVIYDHVAGVYEGAEYLPSSQPTAYDTWQLLSTTKTIRADADEAFCRIALNETSLTTLQVYIDDAELDDITPGVRPVVGSFAEAVYAQLQPVQFLEEELDYPLLRYIGALSEMFQPLDYMSSYNWEVLLDVNRIADEGLPWLGQFIGVVIDTSLPYDNQRQQIRDHIAWGRGTVSAIVNVVRNAIGFNAPISIRERKPDAYSFEIVIYANPTTSQYEGIYETQPDYEYIVDNWISYETIWEASGGIAAVTAAALTQKPAGLLMTLRVSVGQDYWDLYNRYPTYLEIYNTFPTYLEVYNTVPTTDLITVSHVASLADYLAVWNGEQSYSSIYYDFLAY